MGFPPKIFNRYLATSLTQWLAHNSEDPCEIAGGVPLHLKSSSKNVGVILSQSLDKREYLVIINDNFC